MESTRPIEAVETPPPTFGERVRGLLVAPSATLSDVAERIDWVRPAILMLAGVLLFWAPVFYQLGASYRHLFETLPPPGAQPGMPPPPTAPAENEFARIFGAAWSGVTVFSSVLQAIWTVASSWFARTGLLFLVGLLFQRHIGRRFFPLFAAVGWAWFPLFLQSCLACVVFIVFPHLAREIIPMPRSFEQMQSTSAMMGIMTGGWVLWIFYFATPFVWWNWFLCVVSVREAFKIDWARASLVVAIQILLHAMWVIGGYLVGQLWFQAMSQLGPQAPIGPPPPAPPAPPR